MCVATTTDGITVQSSTTNIKERTTNMKEKIKIGVLAFIAGAVAGTKYGKQATQWIATMYAKAKEKCGKKDDTDGFESPTE